MSEELATGNNKFYVVETVKECRSDDSVSGLSSCVRVLSLSSMQNEVSIKAYEDEETTDECTTSSTDLDRVGMRSVKSLREMATNALYGKDFIPRVLTSIKKKLRNGYINSRQSNTLGEMLVRSSETLNALSKCLAETNQLMQILSKITKRMCLNSVGMAQLQAEDFARVSSIVLTAEELQYLHNHLALMARENAASSDTEENVYDPDIDDDIDFDSIDIDFDFETTDTNSNASSMRNGSSSSYADATSSSSTHGTDNFYTDGDEFKNCHDDDTDLNTSDDNCNAASSDETNALDDDGEEECVDEEQTSDGDINESSDLDEYNDTIPYYVITQEDSGIHCWDSTMSTTDDEDADYSQ